MDLAGRDMAFSAQKAYDHLGAIAENEALKDQNSLNSPKVLVQQRDENSSKTKEQPSRGHSTDEHGRYKGPTIT